MRAKYINKNNKKNINQKNKTTFTIDKVLIIGLLFIFVFYNIHSVYAFDYPKIPDNYFVQDKANVLSIETKNLVNSIHSYYHEEKNIDSSLVTISDPVGDKTEYTKQLKKWWKVGDKNNGFIIAVYPESKDMVEIVLDNALKQYISNADIKRYKEKIESGINNKNLDAEIKEITTDLEILLKDYTKKDTFIETIKSILDSFMFNVKPKEKSVPFENVLNKLIRELEKR